MTDQNDDMKIQFEDYVVISEWINFMESSFKYDEGLFTERVRSYLSKGYIPIGRLNVIQHERNNGMWYIRELALPK